MASSPRRLAGALTAAALAVGVLAEPAAAAVTFTGIGHVEFAMSEAEVKDTLGPPSSTKPGRDRASTMLIYRRHKLEVFLHRADDRVVSIGTRSRLERTVQGLGVDTASLAVRARLRGEKCGSERETVLCSVQRGDRVM